MNARLFSLSGNGRAELWHVAWRQARAHPLLGGGAGSYERFWLHNRPTSLGVQDAHNLYLETLAELGPVGLTALLAVLGVPLVGAVRARRRPWVPLAGAAYAAYLAHAAVDWDWELSGLTLAALLCGLACLFAGRTGDERTLGSAACAVGAGMAGLVSAAAIVALLGNAPLGASDAAARSGHWRAAERHARTAIRWTPWSSAGWQRLGEAQLALHHEAAARRSFRTAIARDDRDWVLWLDLARATRGPAQIAAVAQVLRLDPRDASVGQFLVMGLQP